MIDRTRETFLRQKKDVTAGGPALTILACTIPTEAAPPLRSLQGWVAMLRVLFDPGAPNPKSRDWGQPHYPNKAK
jgi:hypothetical protein